MWDEKLLTIGNIINSDTNANDKTVNVSGIIHIINEENNNNNPPALQEDQEQDKNRAVN
jgi:hypothetical protein